MKILVTGGAGFVGSVLVEYFLQRSGHTVHVLDNLANGKRESVSPEANFTRLDLVDRAEVLAYFGRNEFDVVFHLAAEALVPESLRDPGRFFRANVNGGINLLDAMVESSCRSLFFSSTAAVYGQASSRAIKESDLKVPSSPYGESKLAFEKMLDWYAGAHGLQFISFRYFNACGATALHGEDRHYETHLIPLALNAAQAQTPLTIFGDDYPTPDGTCIRDYVHVLDIARAHEAVLPLLPKLSGRAYNLGNGFGFTNLQVVEAIGKVTGRPVPTCMAGRRPGDPAALTADVSAIRQDANWSTAHSSLEEIIASAWRWKIKQGQAVTS